MSIIRATINSSVDNVVGIFKAKFSKKLLQKRPIIPIEPHELEIGDHIAVRDDTGYYHHGLVSTKVNDDIFVLNFVGSSREDAKVCMTFLPQFLNQRTQLYRIQYSPEEQLPIQETLKVAKDFLDTLQGAYDLLNLNCEHIVAYWKTGVGRSNQVDTIDDLPFSNQIKKAISQENFV